jgi:hypothetical protein
LQPPVFGRLFLCINSGLLDLVPDEARQIILARADVVEQMIVKPAKATDSILALVPVANAVNDGFEHGFVSKICATTGVHQRGIRRFNSEKMRG